MSGNKKIEQIMQQYGDIETFIDENISEEDAEFAESLGEARGVEVIPLNEETIGKLVLTHGYKEDDYIVTIAPIKGKFKISEEQVIRGMIIMLDKYLPKTIEVTMFPPGKDWEIQEFAAKIKEARHAWQLSDEMLKSMAVSVAEEMTKFI